MKFVRVLKAGNQVDRYNKLFTADDTLDDVIEKYLLNKITKDDVLFYMNWNEFDEDDVDWNTIEKEYKKCQIKKSKLLKASDWKVEKISETDWIIKSPDGTYKNSNGKDYHFKTKEDALEELDYLRAEHKFDKKSYKYPRIEKEGDIYHVLYAEGTKSKQFDNKKDAEEFKKSIRSKLNKKAGESYGWVVNPEDAFEKLSLWVEAVGAEAALDDLARAMGPDELSDNLAFIFRNNDFKEGCSDYEEEVDE